MTLAAGTRNEYLARFVERLPQMDDDAVLRTLVRMDAARSEFQPEAIAAVREEVARRGLTPAQASEAMRRASQDAANALQEHAVRLALEGHSAARIEQQLKARGLDEASAEAMARRAWKMPEEQLKRAGRRNMVAGATICLLGLAITATGYYRAATDSGGGGGFVIAWGAVLFGALQFFRGARQYPNSRIPPEPE